MNKLIIAPHADDEALGCASILDKDTYVLVCSADSERMMELTEAAFALNYTFLRNDGVENRLDNVALINYIEYWINTLKPDMVFIPHPGYHQDHQVSYNAAIAALRPHDRNFFVNKILIYEGIHDFIWSDKLFTPNYYVPLDIDKKIKAFSYYKSQMQPHRSLESITQLAALRGKQSNYPYAEAFQIKRWVE